MKYKIKRYRVDAGFSGSSKIIKARNKKRARYIYWKTYSKNPRERPRKSNITVKEIR